MNSTLLAGSGTIDAVEEMRVIKISDTDGRGPFKDYTMLRHIKIVDRLGLLIAIFTLGFVAYGVWSFKTLNEIKVGGPVYGRIEQSQKLIADVLPPPAYIVESYLVCLQIANVGADLQRSALIERLRTLQKQHQSSDAFWRKAGLDKEPSDALLNQAYGPAMAFYTMAFNEFFPAVHRSDRVIIAQSLAKLTRSYDAHRLAINRVVVLAQDRAQKDEQWATEYVEYAAVRQIAILVLSLTLAVWLAVLIRFSITLPLTKALAIARSVAAGELNVQTDENVSEQLRAEYALVEAQKKPPKLQIWPRAHSWPT